MTRRAANPKLAQQIRLWREENHMTRVYLASALGISRQRLWLWERYGIPQCDVVLVRLAVRQLHATRLDI